MSTTVRATAWHIATNCSCVIVPFALFTQGSTICTLPISSSPPMHFGLMWSSDDSAGCSFSPVRAHRNDWSFSFCSRLCLLTDRFDVFIYVAPLP